MWRENIDWQPVLSKRVVINYIAKYAAKAEKGSETFHDMLMRISSIQNPNEPAARAYRTLLSKTIVDRDIGAQETCHLLLELPLCESSRRFVVVNVGRKVFKQVKVDANHDHNENSLIEAYTKRPIEMESLPLIEVARSWSYDKRRHGDKWLPRINTAIVRVFPRFSSAPARENDKFVEFCWSELVLYKPFRDFHQDIGMTSDDIVQNWDNFHYNPWHIDRNPMPRDDPPEYENEDEVFPNLQKDTRDHEWELISGLYKNNFINANEFDMLGFRDRDVMENWSSDYINEDTSNRAVNFISQKRQIDATITTDRVNNYSYESLGEKQRKAYNTILEHYRGRHHKEPLHMIIQGTAGTGKSYLIGAIKHAMETDSLPNKSPLLLLAPTGVAAFNISASTIHSALKIPVRDMIELQGSRLISLQEEMRHVKYILIDEMSFIGRNLLTHIDARLRQAFPENANVPFGGRSIILVGDLGQLPPVMDKPAYACEGHAKELWNLFITVVTLDTIFRQDGQSNDQRRFRYLLMNVRDAIPTLEDWKLLMERTDTNMNGSTKELFDKSIHLFSTNDDVHNHNKRCLRSLNRPVARSVATRVSSNYSAEADEEKLDNELLISVGARVMLTSNLWTNAGLVNGALGEVEQIVYNPGITPPEPPTYVLVRFDKYVGVPWDEAFPQIVPIIPIERGRERQIPLRLAWGLTIHKSQGLTLEKATINIGKTERQGLTFTAISRVKSLDGLRFQPPFSYDRYEKMGKCAGVSKRKDEEERLKSLCL